MAAQPQERNNKRFVRERSMTRVVRGQSRTGHGQIFSWTERLQSADPQTATTPPTSPEHGTAVLTVQYSIVQYCTSLFSTVL